MDGDGYRGKDTRPHTVLICRVYDIVVDKVKLRKWSISSWFDDLYMVCVTLLWGSLVQNAFP
jgi:hypothetical protein